MLAFPLPSRILAVLGAAILCASPAAAKIDLVTLPERDRTELTIYNSQDLTLARESRTLSFSKGANQIQFSWANTLIDPTSLQLDLGTAKGLTMVDAVYPANTQELIVWNIEAQEDVSAPVTITYFTSGLTWSSDYVLKANSAETALQMQPRITVRNNSGEDFSNAETRVVVGEINLVEMIAELARRGIAKDDGRLRDEVVKWKMMSKSETIAEMDMAMPMAQAAPSMAGRAQAAEIIKKAVSEYQLYRVEGKEDILNGWGKQLPMPAVKDIKFDLSYEIDPNRYGPEPTKIYRLKNTTDHNLGKDPLPEGQFYVYTDDGRAGLRYEGSTHHKYIPLGEDIELNLGNDGLLQFEERTVRSQRSELQFDNYGSVVGWDETRTVELELRNARERAVPVKLTHVIPGDWTMSDASDKTYESVDQQTVRWNLSVPASSKTVIRYVVVVRNGSRAKR
ncbi:DUF4139 domain-containing protein [bacterium]|nr:DUF4139 domain-containing protein [bacterium]